MNTNDLKFRRIGSEVPSRWPLAVMCLIAGAVAGCSPKSTSSVNNQQPIAGTVTTPRDLARPDLRAAASAPAGGPESDGGVESIEPWSYNNREGRLVRTTHYRIFTTQPDTVLNGRLPVFLEAALNEYRRALTGSESPLPAPLNKLDTYILATRPDWALITKQMTGDKAPMFLQIPRGGFAFDGRAILFDIGARDTLSIAAHEGWHQYTQRVFVQPLPIWLEEGLATFFEGYRFDGRGKPSLLPWANTERFDQLRRAHARGQILPLTQLVEQAPQNLFSSGNDNALTFYAQVWALALFLNEAEGGRHQPVLRNILQDAAAGRLAERLLQHFLRPDAGRALTLRRGSALLIAYSPVSIDELDDGYARFVEQLVQPGSRQAIVAGQSPFAAKTQGPSSRQPSEAP